MELLNLSFVILLAKVTACVLLGVLGIYLLVSSEDTKRAMRDSFCNRIFGFSDAILLSKFIRSLQIIASLLLLLSLVAAWFLLFRGFFVE